MVVQIVDPASGAARVLEVIAQASLNAYTPRIQVQGLGFPGQFLGRNFIS
jgi:hypothetical protein